jgi:RNA polymerase sigma factor (sigma-70 family)
MYGRTSGVIRQLARVFQEGTLAGLSDREILEQFINARDEAAFEALLVRHGPMVWNVCRRILRDPDDAEDAFQATFLALACKARDLHVGESLGPWLYRVAYRVAARARADRRRRGDRERSGGPIPEPKRPDGDPSNPDETARIIHEELDRLPERLRAPIVLCYLGGMTHERAAQQIGCPVGTVRSRLARARARLHGRITRRGLATAPAALGARLASDACASTIPSPISRSLVKTAAQLVAGTASLRGGCGLTARVAALLEGVLKVLRAKQIASSLTAVAVIGVVATVAGLSVFSASGQTGDGDDRRPESKRARDVLKDDERPAVKTIVKTYYVGDLILPPGNQLATAKGGGYSHPWVDMTPVIDLITNTVAKGTWTVDYGPPGAATSDGRAGAIMATGTSSKTVGHVTPFFLSISVIVRHTPEVHDQVANLLRHLRRLLDAPNHPGGVEGYDREFERLGITTPADDPKPAAPSRPDRNARIRQLLDELRQEVEKLPKGQD